LVLFALNADSAYSLTSASWNVWKANKLYDGVYIYSLENRYAINLHRTAESRRVSERPSSPLANFEPHNTNHPKAKSSNESKENKDITIVVIYAKIEELKGRLEDFILGFSHSPSA
jgi:hypothetical protein